MKAVKAFIILTGSCLLFIPLWCISQNSTLVNLRTRVNIGANTIRFDSLVSKISKQTAAKFSFNTKKITPAKLFMLKPGEQTLEDVLLQIKKKTGIYYKIIGYHIILLDKQPKPTTSKQTGNYSTPIVSFQKSSEKKRQADSPLKKTSPKSFLPTKNKTQKPAYPLAKKSMTDKNQLNYFSMEETILPTPVTEITKPLISGKADSLQQENKKTAVTTHLSEGASKIKAIPNPIQSDTVASSTIKSIHQKKRKTSSLKFFAGIEFLRTFMLNDQLADNLTGAGFSIKLEKSFTVKFSGTLAAGLNLFIVKYNDTTSRLAGDTAIKHFTATTTALAAPFLAGIKYYPWKRIYVSSEAGLVFQVSSVGGTHLAISPSAGIMLPLENNSTIDLGVKFVHIVAAGSSLENPIIKRGGYSLLSLRAAYGFNSIKLTSNKKERSTVIYTETKLQALSRFDIGFQGFGFSFEPRLSNKTTMDLSIGAGGTYEVGEGFFKYKWNWLAPAFYFAMTPKLYYNRQKRIAKNKRTDLNAGNYVGVRIKYVTRSTDQPASLYFNNVLINGHWGLQRPVGKRWIFNAHFGGGYSTEARVLSQSFGTIYPAIDFKFSYAFSKRQS